MATAGRKRSHHSDDDGENEPKNKRRKLSAMELKEAKNELRKEQKRLLDLQRRKNKEMMQLKAEYEEKKHKVKVKHSKNINKIEDNIETLMETLSGMICGICKMECENNCVMIWNNVSNAKSGCAKSMDVK
eukprot:409504_1